MMKKFCLILFICFIIGSFIGIAEAGLINGGFETGDFSGWSLTIPDGATANVVTSHTGISTNPMTDVAEFSPQEGKYFLELKTDGPYDDVTMAFRYIWMEKGDILSGSAAFDSGDAFLNDSASVKIYDGGGVLVGTPWETYEPDDRDWTPWQWTAESADTYKLVYGVSNSFTSQFDSYALFDATSVPEPCTMILFFSLLIGAIGIQGKQFV
jgi:hypothetical protein